MSGSRSASWRFGGLADASPSGPVLTLSGGIAVVAGEQAIRQSIMMLLSTIPGERVMRPDYGCPLHVVVLSPNDATTAGLAIHYVRQALLRFEPRVEIVSLDAGRPEPTGGAEGEANDLDNEAALTIWLQYRLRETGWVGDLSVTLDMSPGQA